MEQILDSARSSHKYDELMSTTPLGRRFALFVFAVGTAVLTVSGVASAVPPSAVPASATPLGVTPFAASSVPTASASELEAVLSSEFFSQINAERARRGIAPVTLRDDLTVASLNWTDAMANSNTLSHSTDGRAEIVGYGSRSGQVTDAFMRSPGHRNLIVDPNLTTAGIGVACDANGRLWVTVQFLRADTSLATRSSSPAQPIATPASSGSGCSTPVVNTGAIRRLYQAYFLRPSDQTGLDYWAGQQARGVELAVISEQFAASPEFASRYGSLSNRAFVDLVYRNVLGRASDGGGLDYWVGQLNRGMPRGEMMIGFSESPEFINLTGIR